MLRSITYKVVNDANDALNVFAEMVSIKLALQSLRENRKKDSFSKILILWPNPVKENNNRNKIINSQSMKIAHIVQHAVR